ncbi:MAG: hypothetical protein M1608_05610, partial [Candidatus Omnitrophica bacterium]|nr:hypothetical protein [Candidatus Omnitrophota bacterium]
AIDEIFKETVVHRSPPLVPGQYYWRVRAETGNEVTPWSEAILFEVKAEGLVKTRALRVGISSGASLEIPYFTWNPIPHPLKDTLMVCLECGLNPSHPWDGLHQYDPLSCPHDTFSDAPAVFAGINHYYGGNLTVDEAAWYGNGFRDPSDRSEPEGDLGHGNAEGLDGLAEVLGGTSGTTFEKSDSIDDWPKLKASLDRMIPGVGWFHFITEKAQFDSGAVLVYGYEEDFEQTPPKRLLKVRTPGLGLAEYDWDYVSYGEVGCPLAPPGSSVEPRKSDPGIAQDSDGDGLCDFDEIERFGTDPDDLDSDRDGINDKTEVWSYLFGTGRVPRKPDIDGDGMRAEMDPDSDNDGCLDGEEDVNGNGTLGANILGTLWKEADETDPFYKQTYTLSGHANRSTISFYERVSTEWSLEELVVSGVWGQYVPVPNTEVELSIVPSPAHADFDGNPGPIVLTTDKEGKLQVNVCAKDENGEFVVRCVYKPCDGAEKTEGKVTITVVPTDWIFAVQEEAVLDGPRVVTNSPASDIVMPVTYAHHGDLVSEAKKDAGLQTARGHFYDPWSKEPGKHIQSIYLTPLRQAPGESIVLRIDGEEAPGGCWERSAPEENPSSWEIQLKVDDSEYFPCYLCVTAIGGNERRLTPLVWRKECSSSGIRIRWFTGSETRMQGDPGFPYSRLTDDFTQQTAYFFFGDGLYGEDTSKVWPGSLHTEVSFIPHVKIMGYSEGQVAAYGEDPRSDSNLGNQSGGERYLYSVFADKNVCYVVPTYSWTIERGFCSEPYCGIVDLKAELAGIGPLQPPPFLEGFEFERDYIGDELEEIEDRGVDAPHYRIQMKVGEP